MTAEHPAPAVADAGLSEDEREVAEVILAAYLASDYATRHNYTVDSISEGHREYAWTYARAVLASDWFRARVQAATDRAKAEEQERIAAALEALTNEARAEVARLSEQGRDEDASAADLFAVAYSRAARIARAGGDS